jgi:hypothetical protein
LSVLATSAGAHSPSLDSPPDATSADDATDLAKKLQNPTGPATFSAFLSPNKPVNGWLWAIGPVFQIPTASNSSLGSNVWGGGPTGALVYMKGAWVTGALANNVWSFSGTPGLSGTRYGELAHLRRQGVDAADRSPSRPCREDQRNDAGELRGRRLLQRAASAIRPDLAAQDVSHPYFRTARSTMSAANEPAYL